MTLRGLKSNRAMPQQHRTASKNKASATLRVKFGFLEIGFSYKHCMVLIHRDVRKAIDDRLKDTMCSNAPLFHNLKRQAAAPDWWEKAQQARRWEC